MSDDGADLETTADGAAGTTSQFPLDALFASEGTRGIAPTIGRFSILHELGHGGMGVVYLGYDARLDRRAAVKLLRDEGAGEKGRARLLREARALARLSHPNVVPIYETGEHGDDAYIAMEYVAGRTLREWMHAEPHTTAQILEVFVAAGHGLAAAHTHGLTHRDFKPENVMVGEDGRARVMDFGLVHKLGAGSDTKEEPAIDRAAGVDLTATGALLGTPAYMAPEQYRGEQTGPYTDQFSFCVSLWEALFRVRPFAGNTISELTTNILGGNITAPGPDAKVPARIRKALERGMAVAPEKRWPSLGALLRVLEGELSVARRQIAAVVIITFLAMLIAAAGFAWQKAAMLRMVQASNQMVMAEQRAMESSELLAEGNSVDALMVAIEAAGMLADESGVIPTSLPAAVSRSLYEASEAELSWGVVATFPSPASVAAFTSDGTRLALGKHPRVQGATYHHIEIHSMEDGAVVARLLGHHCILADMEFFADDTRLLTHCADAGPVQLWDTSGALLTSFDSQALPTVSPAGHVVATRSGNDVNLIDGSGAAMATLRGHTGEPTALVFSADGSRLATVGPESVRVWDAGTGKALTTIESAGVLGVAWFADGRLATVSADHQVRIWRSESALSIGVLAPGSAPVPVLDREDFHGLVISPNGERVAIYMGRGVWLWNAQTGELIEHIVDHAIPRMGEHHPITWRTDHEPLVFSSDSSSMTIRRHDGTILLLDADSGAAILASDTLAMCNAFSPDGKLLALEEDGIEIWDVDSGRRLKTLEGTMLSHLGVFSPDGRFLVTLGYAVLDEWWIDVWDTKAHASSSVVSSEVSTAADVLAIAADDGRVVTADTDGHASGLRLAEFSPGGRVLASIDRNEALRLWDTRSDTLIGGPFELPEPAEVLAASDDGIHIALVYDELMELRDARSAVMVAELAPRDGRVRAMAFSPDGRLIAAMAGSNLRIWSVPEGELLRELHGYGDSVAFSPDGTRVSTNKFLWDLATGERISYLENNESNADVVFSPDGTVLASGSSLWDGFTGAYLGKLEGHEQRVRAQGFLAGGERIITASRDAVIVRDTALPMEAACGRLQPYVTAYAKVAWACDPILRNPQSERAAVPRGVDRSWYAERWVAETVAVLILLALMLAVRVSGRLEQLCERLPRGRALAYHFSFTAITTMLVIVGAKTQLVGPLMWIGTIEALWIILLIPALAFVLHARPDRWWIWVSFTAIVGAAIAVLVAPEFVIKLNNLTPTGLATLAALAQPFLHADPQHGYAAFAAHAEGHQVLAHRGLSLGVFAVIVTIGLFGVHRLGSLIARRFGDRLGFASLDQRGAVPLVLLLILAFGLVSAPVLNALARAQERRADQFALEQGGDARSCAANAVIQSRDAGLSVVRPGLANMIWHMRQPTLAERIEACSEN